MFAGTNNLFIPIYLSYLFSVCVACDCVLVSLCTRLKVASSIFVGICLNELLSSPSAHIADNFFLFFSHCVFLLIDWSEIYAYGCWTMTKINFTFGLSQKFQCDPRIFNNVVCVCVLQYFLSQSVFVGCFFRLYENQDFH